MLQGEHIGLRSLGGGASQLSAAGQNRDPAVDLDASTFCRVHPVDWRHANDFLHCRKLPGNLWL
jgi:hypothetical protein